MTPFDSVVSLVNADSHSVQSDTAPAICEACEGCDSELFYCNDCQLILCAGCWSGQLSHRPKVLARGGASHDKTELELWQQIQDVFATSISHSDLEQLHVEDQKTAWFGVGYFGFPNENLFLRDYGRYENLILGANTHQPRLGRKLGYIQSQDVAYAESCHPSLVSFVGQTGAGKSTLMRLLIKTAKQGLPGNAPVPIAGAPDHDFSTTAGIHLYADPNTVGSAKPILYADSQGLGGGTREPMASQYRRTRSSIISIQYPSSSSDIEYSTERQITWATDDVKRSTEFAVNHLYPRILFTFSDVVVFVHRNTRTIEEDALDKIIEWAVAVETSSNQPVLPCAILVFNACEYVTSSNKWDVDTATISLLKSLADTIDNKPSFKKYAELWRVRGKQIQNLEDLILCYYSSLRVVYVPTNGRPKLIHAQALKLYAEIQRGVSIVHDRKLKLRMLLHGVDFQAFFQQGLNHFSTEINKSFDFVKASFFNSRQSSESTQNLLFMALSLKQLSHYPTKIFDQLGILIASSIMLEAIRSDIKGTADRILPNYSAKIDAVLTEFCNKHLTCEYLHKAPDFQKLGAGWSNDVLFQTNRQELRLRCTSVKVGHGTRGHNLSDGSWVSGKYVTSFSVESHRTAILNNIYFELRHLLEQLSDHRNTKEVQLETAIRIHKDQSLKRFFITNRYHVRPEFQNTKFCISCIFETAFYTLPCGHSLCIKCIRAYGHPRGKTMVESNDCPLHSQPYSRQRSRSIYIKPREAGIRVLSLDDGGVSSVAQVEILKMLEEEFQGQLSLQCLFDLIVGQGTGGILALGLGSRGWTAQECETGLLTMLKESFASKLSRRISGLYQKQLGFRKYDSKPLEASLMKLFTAEQRMVDQASDHVSHGDHVRVAVRTQSVGAYPILFTNYLSKTSYTDVKLWEGARATMSQKSFFKPFIHEKLGPLSTDHTKQSNSALPIAVQASETNFGEENEPVLDVVLSLGLCTKQANSTPTASSMQLTDNSDWQNILSSSKAQSLEASTLNLQVEVPSLPEFDDLSNIQSIQGITKSQIKPKTIRQLARRLFASLFYLESINSAQQLSDDRFLVLAQVLCRIQDDSTEIHRLGKLMQTDAYSNLSFVFREDGGNDQIFVLEPDVIKNELDLKLQFNMPKLHVHLNEKHTTFFAGIRFKDGEEYPFSGFPRQLVTARNSISANVKLDGLYENCSSTSSLAWSPPSLFKFPILSKEPSQTSPVTPSPDTRPVFQDPFIMNGTLTEFDAKQSELTSELSAPEIAVSMPMRATLDSEE